MEEQIINIKYCPKKGHLKVDISDNIKSQPEVIGLLGMCQHLIMSKSNGKV